MSAIELLDGRVLVIEQHGCNSTMSDLGGPPNPPQPIDLLDLDPGRWTESAALNAPRSGFVAVRLRDGRVLVTGGNNGWHGSYSSTKIFDPATDRWAAGGLLNAARKDPVGALLEDGRVLVAGGTFSEGYRDEEDFFSGRTPSYRDLTSAEIYDPVTDRWTLTGSLDRTAAAGTAYALPDGRVLVAGPAHATEPGAEIYDPRLGTWQPAGSFDRLQGSSSVVLGDGSLLIVGGTAEVETTGPDGSTYSYVPVATVRRFDPSSGNTVEVAPLPAPRTGAVAVRMADGRVLVAGGTEDEQLDTYVEAPPTATVFIYDPTHDAWKETTPMPFADRPALALLLADGSVLVTGGSIPLPVAETDGCGPILVGWTARFVPAPRTGG